MASALRVLFIGGSGIISSACCRLAVQRGIDLYALNRGATQLRPLPAEVTILHGDVRDPDSVRDALGGLEFDVVVNWVAFTQDHIEADLEQFRGKISQYVFISSASAYQTPPARVPVTESTPLSNPYWHYSRNKIACEDRLVRLPRGGLSGNDHPAVPHLRPHFGAVVRRLDPGGADATGEGGRRARRRHLAMDPDAQR